MLSTTPRSELLAEFRNLRLRLEEAEATIRNIGNGGKNGKPFFTRAVFAARLLNLPTQEDNRDEMSLINYPGRHTRPSAGRRQSVAEIIQRTDKVKDNRVR